MKFEEINKLPAMAQESEEGERIYAESSTEVRAKILYTLRFGKGYPIGEVGEVRQGYSFFEVKKGKESTKETYLTSRIGKKPELKAVTKEQFLSWKKKKIIARPTEFIWSQEKGLWVIKDRPEK